MADVPPRKGVEPGVLGVLGVHSPHSPHSPAKGHRQNVSRRKADDAVPPLT